MKEPKFTKGPWYAVEYAGFFNLQTTDEYSYDNLLDKDCIDEAEANANLCAASPAMYEALQEVAAYFDTLFSIEGVRNIALENKVTSALTQANL